MNWRNVFKGAAMGFVEAVPGVSSSTIAMLLGIYEKLIESISLLTSKEWKRGLRFLVPVGVGVGVGLVISLKLVSFFLERYPMEIHYLFIGLIIGLIPFIWKTGLQPSAQHTYEIKQSIIMVLSLVIVASLNLLPRDHSVMVNLTMGDYIFLFGSGWLASIALVLPGISGALILMIVGAYQTAVNGAVNLDLPIILVVGFGVVCGVLMTGRLVRYLLHKFKQETYSAIIGLLIGSLFVLYPGVPISVFQIMICISLFFVGLFAASILGKK
ncbi:DUF368 domain-containing protein [Alkalihalobacillus sp. 1P02AB]|uniref:DUF368 domain-containing protein n=1 Tax=Alkalihalobacillus sp. 1P02AB TaxID=3132260 RepID=UPI0039A4912F